MVVVLHLDFAGSNSTDGNDNRGFTSDVLVTNGAAGIIKSPCF